MTRRRSIILCMTFAGRAAFALDAIVVENGVRADADALPAPVVYWSETRTLPRPVRLHFVLADLASPRIEAAVAVSNDPDGDGPASAVLRNPLEFASEQHFVAAINANAFMHLLDATEAEKKRGWYAGKPVRLFGLAADDGTLRHTHDDRRVPIWFGEDGRARVGKPGETNIVRHAAADWEGPILRDGNITAPDNPALLPRALAGTNADGTRLLMVVIEGRQKGYSEGMTLEECGALMLDRGCASAVNFDGGGSAVMLVATNGALRAVGHPPGRWLRPVPVMLGIRHTE